MFTVLDFTQNSQRVQCVLIDCETVIHVELRPRDNVPELRNVGAQQPGFGHGPEGHTRLIRIQQNGKERGRSAFIHPESVIDRAERLGQDRHRIRM